MVAMIIKILFWGIAENVAMLITKIGGKNLTLTEEITSASQWFLAYIPF